MVATRNSWKAQGFNVVREIPFAASYSLKEFEQLQKNGLIPAQMEDKWFAYCEDSKLFFHRSWTGQAVYRVEFTLYSDHALVTNAVCAQEVLTKEGVEYHAEFLDFLIRNLLLDQSKPLPRPAGIHESAPGLYQHVMSRTGYAEKVFHAKRPWWKFWR